MSSQFQKHQWESLHELNTRLGFRNIQENESWLVLSGAYQSGSVNIHIIIILLPRSSKNLGYRSSYITLENSDTSVLWAKNSQSILKS